MIDLINGVADGWWSWVTEVSLQVTVVGALVWLLDLPLRKRAWVQVRYALWLMVFLRLVLPPGLSLPTSLPSRIQTIHAGYVSEATSQEAPTRTHAVVIEQPDPSEAGPASVPTAAAAAVKPRPRLWWRSWVFLAWATVWAALAAVLTGKVVLLRRQAAGGASAPEMLRSALTAASQKLCMRREPRLVLTEAVGGPSVFGVWRPVILLPKSAIDGLGRSQIEHMLLHELAHIRRRDLAINALQTVLHIVFWFHPVVWLAGRRLRQMRELCCDAAVSTVLASETPLYRLTLVAVARRMMQSRTPFTRGLMGLFESTSCMEARLSHLKRPLWKTHKRAVAAALVAAVAMVIFVLPMGACRAEPALQDEPEETKPTEPKVFEGGSLRAVLQSGADIELAGVRYTRDAPVIAVSIPCPGVSAQDVEITVTAELEKRLSAIEEVRAVRGISAEGRSELVIEFKRPFDRDRALQQVRDNLTQAAPYLHGAAGEPAFINEYKWLPDGSLLESAPLLPRGMVAQTVGEGEDNEGKKVREFILMGRFPPGDQGDHRRITWYIVRPVDASRPGAWWSRQISGEGWLHGMLSHFASGQETATLRVGVATGEWETNRSNIYPAGGELIEVWVSGSRDGLTVEISPPAQTDEGVVVTSTNDQDKELDSRLVIIERDGQVHTGDRHMPSATFSADWTQVTWTFGGLKLSDIHKIEFQTRLYEWIEFRDVALEPGIATDPGVFLLDRLSD